MGESHLCKTMAGVVTSITNMYIFFGCNQLFSVKKTPIVVRLLTGIRNIGTSPFVWMGIFQMPHQRGLKGFAEDAPVASGFVAASWDNQVLDQRRRMKTEGKAKVVASVWLAKCVQFLAVLAVLSQSI